MKVTQSFALPASVEKVAEVLVDPEFNVDLEKLREGVISSEFHMISDQERAKVYELRTKEYKRKKTGGFNRSATVDTKTEFRFDVPRNRLSWVYHGEGGTMFQISGLYSLGSRGDSTLFTHDVTVEVKIPIIGKRIATMIAKEFESEDPRYKKLWTLYLDKSH